MKRTQILTNKLVSLGLSILEMSKTVIYEIYMKPQYGEKARLCYMDTASFIFYIKTKDIYPDIAKDVETRFDTSNFKLGRPLL